MILTRTECPKEASMGSIMSRLLGQTSVSAPHLGESTRTQQVLRGRQQAEPVFRGMREVVMRRAMVLVACAGIALTGCGARTQAGGPPARESTRVVASATAHGGASAVARPVPDQLRFTAKTLDGTEFSGESLLGTPAVLWFW